MIGYFFLGLVTLPRFGGSNLARAATFVGTASSLILFAWLGLWTSGIFFPVTIALGLLATQYALGIESLQRRIRARADAQESSLVALSRLGELPADGTRHLDRKSANQGGLELALELLGDVVSARGVVLIPALPQGELTQERIEWRPRDSSADA